jgi:hypothetical protein
LWHGAGNHYLVFGLLHAAYLVVNHAWRLFHHRFWQDTVSHDRIMKPVGLVLTFIAATVALTYFRADNVAIGSNIAAGMAGLHGITLPNVIESRLPGLVAALAHLGIGFTNGSLPVLMTLYLWMAVLLAIALIPPNILQIMLPWEPAITLPLPYRKDGKLHPFSRVFNSLTWRPTPGWAVGIAALSTFGLLALSQVTEFLYWQF